MPCRVATSCTAISAASLRPSNLNCAVAHLICAAKMSSARAASGVASLFSSWQRLPTRQPLDKPCEPFLWIALGFVKAAQFLRHLLPVLFDDCRCDFVFCLEVV